MRRRNSATRASITVVTGTVISARARDLVAQARALLTRSPDLARALRAVDRWYAQRLRDTGG